MKTCAIFAACVLASAVGMVAAANQGALSVSAQQHVTRVSDALTALRIAPSSRSANAQANRALALLLKDTSSAGDEALAALAGHYLGESTEPECEILARGQRMLPLLTRFNRQPPLVKLATSGAHSRSELIAQIKAGVRCE